jgi:hypothetical protein
VSKIRAKILYFTPECAVGFFSGGVACVGDKLPLGSTVARAGYDEAKDRFYLVAEHDSFDEVQIGESFPEHYPVIGAID